MNVLVISPVNPRGRDGGFKMAVASDVESLCALGARVLILCSVVDRSEREPDLAGIQIREFPVLPGGRARRVLRALRNKVPAAVERYYTKAICDGIREEARTQAFDLVVIEDVSLARWIPLLREVLPRARLILRSHNDMALVTKAQLEAAPLSMKPLYWAEQRRWAGLERFALEQVDETWAITETEKSALAERYGMKNVHYLPVAVDIERYGAIGIAGRSQRRFGHLGTLDLKKSPGMAKFLRDVWPRIQSCCPNSQLLVGGRTTVKQNLVGENVQFLGYVEDELSFLRKVQYLVNPQSIGAGIKLKSLVALAAGRILLSTDIGVQGMRLQHGIHYWNIDFLCRTGQLDRIWKNEELNRRMARRGQQWVREHHSQEVVTARLSELLGTRAPRGNLKTQSAPEPAIARILES